MAFVAPVLGFMPKYHNSFIHSFVLRLLTLCLFAARWLLYLFSTAITLVTALMNWPPVFHVQWLGHIPHGRQHLLTTIVWHSSMRELIGSVMVSSPLLPAFGTLSLLYFRLPSIFLPLKGRCITTLGTRWLDFFFFFFFFFYKSVLLSSLHFFSFSYGMRTQERAHCARSVFPFIKKKREKKKAF